MKSLNRLFLATMIVMTISKTPTVRAQSEFSSATIGIGVVVSDLEKSLNFYTKVIGMKKTGEFDIDGRCPPERREKEYPFFRVAGNEIH